MRPSIALALVVVACGGEAAPPPPPPSSPEPLAAPTPETTSPAASARAALADGRYEQVCEYLVEKRFSPVVCAFIASSARGEAPRLPTLTGWLENHHVRSLRMDMYGMRLGEDDTWEVGVDGSRAILLAHLGPDAVIADEWELVAQRSGTRTIPTSEGPQELDVYREWGLEARLRDLARLPRDRQETARALLSHLLEAWESDYMAEDGSSEGASPPPPAPTSPFAGTWFPAGHPDVRLVLTDSTYLFRFPSDDGLRRIYADIVSQDEAARHVTLQVTRVTRDGRDVEHDMGRLYMTYELRGSTLLRAVSSADFPASVEEELMFVRVPEAMVGANDE